MSPTEALATAIHDDARFVLRAEHDHQECYVEAASILAALPPGWALVSVEDVLERIAVYVCYSTDDCEFPYSPCAKGRAEARRLLGIGGQEP